jgi:hypothetical protein
MSFFIFIMTSRILSELSHWEKSVYDLAVNIDSPFINIIIIDDIDKGRICSILEKTGYVLPIFFPSKSKIITTAHDVIGDDPDPSLLIIILPEIAPKKDEKRKIWNAIYNLKKGQLDRHPRGKYPSKLFNPPRVVVFTSSEPDLQFYKYTQWNIINDTLVEFKS